MGNTVLSRVGICSLGAVGALEAACTDLGSHVSTGKASIEEVILEMTAEENVATDAGLNDMVTDVAISGERVKFTLKGVQQVTAANLAIALGATKTASDGLVFSGGGGTPTFFSGYFHGFKMDGDPKILHICKAYVTPNTSLNLSKTQQLFDIPLTVMVYEESTFVNEDAVAYNTYALLPDTVDVTPPTISTTTPADGATNVAKAATTLVTWLFSEAIRSADVHERNFFVHADDGAIKAGTLALSGDALTVTFTPGAAWAATTKFHTVAMKGIRDLAGNGLAATAVTDFTTGS